MKNISASLFDSSFASISVICKSILGIAILAITQTAYAERIVHSLNGQWQFQRDGAGDEWKTVTVPNSFEEHEGTDFDGVGIYQRTIPAIKLPENARAVLHFQAAATLAEVWFDGKRLGEHLGGWTPFQFDVTDLVQDSSSRSHVIRVRVDEKVGHNSQGFLPVFTPHFGGVWQDVKLLIVTSTWIDESGLLAIGDSESGRIRLEVPLLGDSPKEDAKMFIRHRLLGSEKWSEQQSFDVNTNKNNSVELEIPVKDWQAWSPVEPNLYELEIALHGDKRSLPQGSTNWQPITTRAAFRTIEVEGKKLLLNGKPLAVRGLLNWGYAPPRVAPSIDEARFRQELEFARSYGFNLMKFCLWVPPKRYLEIADEMGMLTWVEYPTWHSRWSPDQLPTLEKEFAEFFRYDRNHPSVVLRSLTCEAGPSADLGVIQSLYDLCHEMVPGSVVEDDSSWIGWNRIHDFYDDHPYGNNHNWVQTIDHLKDHIEEHGEKPLVLGESIAADTWVDPDSLFGKVGDERPFWLPNFLEGNQKWVERIRNVYGDGGLDRLDAESKNYALLMRKYQIETYRREVPSGGYVVSVIRDFPFAGMGLIDFLDRPKWSPEDWNWHRDTMLILHTESDRRSYTSGENFKAELLVSHFGDSTICDGVVTISYELPSDLEVMKKLRTAVSEQAVGTLQKAIDLNTVIPQVDKPTRLVVRAELKMGKETARNEWSF